MPSTFGWTYFSRDALRIAEQQLLAETAGVRDEIGFLIIHQRYADRFFPGTSVLHTRLRYVLFVPWIYEGIRKGHHSGRVARAIERAEVQLTGRLRNAAGGGVIGVLKHPDPTSQPPSVIYWTALGAWGLLRPRADGRLPARSRVHALLDAKTRVGLDDDGEPLRSVDLPFVSLPQPPANWEGEDDIDFTLSKPEATFLYDRLTAVPCPTEPTRPSLLALLAKQGIARTDACWSRPVLSAAGPDAPALRRAGSAASLAAIGRGVYAALVEDLREADGRATSHRHREYLPRVLEEHARRAERLQTSDLEADVGSLPPTLRNVITETLAWLQGGAKDFRCLLPAYVAAEAKRKGPRARLTPDLNGRERRLEWNNDQHSVAEPLHFRWWQVSRLLSDLQGQP